MSLPELRPQTAESELFERLLRDRYSCRAFEARAVPNDVIRAMLETAQRTPSWCNSQPWRVVVTSGTGTERFRTALYEAAKTTADNSDIPPPAGYHGAYRDRRREAGFGLYDSVGITRDDRAGREQQMLENFRLFGAPHALVVHSDAQLGPYGWVDCGAYILSVLLAAQAFGIAAVPQAAIAMQSDLIHEHFGIGSDRVVVAGVSFGYAAEHPINAFRTSRVDLGEVVEWVAD